MDEHFEDDFTKAFNDGQFMTCPFCKDDYVHIESVTINKGGDIIKVDSEDIKISKESADGRGATISIIFWCEGGHHKWEKNYHFHKGNTAIWDRELLYASGRIDLRSFDLFNLWRD